jgi:hypothetical protein
MRELLLRVVLSYRYDRMCYAKIYDLAQHVNNQQLKI